MWLDIGWLLLICGFKERKDHYNKLTPFMYIGQVKSIKQIEIKNELNEIGVWK